MKTVKGFEDFINESVNVKYWADYHEKSTKITSTSKVARTVEDEVEEWNLNNEDGKENEVTNKDEKKVMNLAHDFFKAAGWISADVIQAMIAQEAIGESIVNEADEKPSLDSSTGLIYYFDIPFTSEDMEELLSASKAILNAKFTPNKQFEIQPMIFIKDKVNGGEHTFSVAQIGILGAFFDKNKKSVASRKDF
jgi:hypothetical protein